MSRLSLSGAASRAQALLHQYGITAPSDIDVESMAFDQGVFVLDGPLTGADARLVRRGNRGLIRVREGISDTGRRRFSIAHELAHFLLHTGSPLESCLDPRFLTLYHEDLRERAADDFATQLLMPMDMFSQRCAPPLLPNESLLRGLAAAFRSSLTATVLRYVEIGPVLSAAVLSENGRIKWSRPCDDFRFRLRATGSALHSHTLTAEVSSNSSQGEREGASPAQAWLSDSRVDDSWTIAEVVFPQPRYGSVLSLIWVVPDSPLDRF